MRAGAGSHSDGKRGDHAEESGAEIWNVMPRLSDPGTNTLLFLLKPTQREFCPLLIYGT